MCTGLYIELYSGENKYLISCWFSEFATLQK